MNFTHPLLSTYFGGPGDSRDYNAPKRGIIFDILKLALAAAENLKEAWGK